MDYLSDDFIGKVREWDDMELHRKFWEGEFWVIENTLHPQWGEINKKLDLIKKELHERWERGWKRADSQKAHAE